MSPEMRAQDVWHILELLQRHGVHVWIDGGWAVDACLAEQTRTHSDLDVVIEQRHLEAAVTALRAAGFDDVPRDDTAPWNFVLGDDAGREIDFHVIEFDGQGQGVYGPPETRVVFPPASLTGQGTIAGRPVACMSPDWLVASHIGYEPDEADWHDVFAVCDRFGIVIPDEYRR